MLNEILTVSIMIGVMAMWVWSVKTKYQPIIEENWENRNGQEFAK